MVSTAERAWREPSLECLLRSAVAAVRRKYFSSTSLASMKATSCWRRCLQVVQRVDRLASRRSERSSSWWARGRCRERQGSIFSKAARERLAGKLVAIARARGKVISLGDALRQGTHTGGGLLGRLRSTTPPCRDEGERHAVDLGVLGCEHAVVVGDVARATKARPTTCSQRSCVPKARTPRMWVTVLASQPSVSIETDTTHGSCSPSCPACRPCSSPRAEGPRRSGLGVAPGKALAVLGLELLDLARWRCFLNSAAQRLARLELRGVDQDRVGPVESTGRPRTLLNRSRLPGTSTVAAVVPGRCSQPAIQSKTSLETLVLLQTTMKTGGVCRAPRRPSSAPTAKLVVLLVVAVQAVERAFELPGQLRQAAAVASSLLRPFLGRLSRMCGQRSR